MNLRGMAANNGDDERYIQSLNASSSASHDKVMGSRNRTSLFSTEEHEDDDEDNEEDGPKNQLFGFLFGNVDDDGELDVDYLDEDAKEHFAALASKIGPSLTDLEASIKNQQESFPEALEQEYIDQKADDAIDYEDIEEDFEGPEVETCSDNDGKYFKVGYSIDGATLSESSKLAASILDEDNYDEEDDNDLKDNITTKTGSPRFPEELSLTDVGDENECIEAETETLSEELNETEVTRTDNCLPILYKEDGKVVLRFSEIFGTKSLVKLPDRKQRRRDFFPKEKLCFPLTDDMLEEDEEDFFRASVDQPLASMGAIYAETESINLEEGHEAEVFPSDSLSADVNVWNEKCHSCKAAQSMKEDYVKADVNELETSDSLYSYPLDQYPWEEKIYWGDSSPDNFSKEHSEVENHDLSNIIVEPFGQSSAIEIKQIKESDRALHPQMLRLYNRQFTSNDADLEKSKRLKVRFRSYLKKLSSQNCDLLNDSWTDNILWEQGSGISKEKIIFDLQDDRMLFEILDDKHNLYSHASAMLINPSVKAATGEGDSSGQLSTTPNFNISNDKYYSSRKSSQQQKSLSKKRGIQSNKVVHSLPAMRLQTMKPKLNNKDLANFHRPKALWYPHNNEVAAKEQGQLSSQGPMKIIVMSLGGKASKLHVDAAENLESVKGKAAKKLDFKPMEKIKILYSGKELQEGRSLAEQQVRPNAILHFVRTKVHPWPKAQRVPNESKPRRPPGAFKKKSELSVKDGHLFLMEYCEERPLLLGNAGMGARLLTYYQKRNSGDQTAVSLKSASPCLGTVVPLEPTEKSPFLGDIKPGYTQSSIETNMYRAPVFPHKVATTDYLLVRSAKGKISLRRIDHLYVVGQQEPHIEVVSPGSKSLQNFLANRLLVYVYRGFRASEKSRKLPYIRAAELATQFPSYSESFLRKRLKHCADLQKGSSGEMLWVMKRTFRLPSEDELRTLVTPENVCSYESMQAGLHHLKRLGINKLTGVSGIASAMTQLPDEAVALATASHIERELQMTSWNLSSNFVSSTKQGRECIERMEITGAGDPSGRGLGFSYLRVAPKPPIPTTLVKKKVAAVRGSSTVTGTDADLRRLSMDAAKEVLMKFNVEEAEIEKMGRWDRIAMVRRLSSEHATSGFKVDATVLNKFARGQRMSFLQLQQQAREKCQEIWDKQFQTLAAANGEPAESDNEGNSDLDSYIGDLENLLDAEEAEDNDLGDNLSQRDKRDSKGVTHKRVSLVQAEEMEDEAAEAAELCRMLMDDDDSEEHTKTREGLKENESRSRGIIEIRRDQMLRNKDDSSTKTKKVLKRIIRTTQHDGTVTSREVVITDPKEVARLLTKKKTIQGRKQTENVRDLDESNLKIKDIKGKESKDVKTKKPKDKPVREHFICGACGNAGHMRTNKKCPMYNEDTDTVLEKAEVENQSQVVAATEEQNSSIGLKSKKKKTLKSVKQVAQMMPEIEIIKPANDETKPLGKSLPVKFVVGSSSNKITEDIAQGTLDSGCNDELRTNDNLHNTASNSVKVKVKTKKRKMEDADIMPWGQPVPSDQNAGQPLVSKQQVEGELKAPKLKFKKPRVISMQGQQELKVSLEIDKRKREEREQRELEEAREREIERQMQEGLERQKQRAWKERRILEEREKRQRFEEERKRQEEESKQRKREELRRKHEEEERRQRVWADHEAQVEREKNERKRIKVKRKEKTERQRDWEAEEEYKEVSRHKRHDNRALEREKGQKRRVSELSNPFTENFQPTKRRRGGEVLLSNILEKIVDVLKSRNDISYLFLKPVTKKEAPDYSSIVRTPMDLGTIRAKVKRLEYKSRGEFQYDINLISHNAHIYNDNRNPGIPPLADQLVDLCDELILQFDSELATAEEAIEEQ